LNAFRLEREETKSVLDGMRLFVAIRREQRIISRYQTNSAQDSVSAVATIERRVLDLLYAAWSESIRTRPVNASDSVGVKFVGH